MITSFVLLNVERDRIATVAETLAGMEGVTEVYSVAGAVDLIAVIRATDHEMIADIVTGHMLKVDGIISSETLIAFKVYSRHDLERMFSIGLE